MCVGHDCGLHVNSCYTEKGITHSVKKTCKCVETCRGHFGLLRGRTQPLGGIYCSGVYTLKRRYSSKNSEFLDLRRKRSKNTTKIRNPQYPWVTLNDLQRLGCFRVNFLKEFFFFFCKYFEEKNRDDFGGKNGRLFHTTRLGLREENIGCSEGSSVWLDLNKKCTE